MRGVLCRLVLSILFIIMHGHLRAQITNHIVISEIYGGGGNSGSKYKHDYVELYNPTSSAVTMTNWTIQYGSPGSSSLTGKTVFSGTIDAHSFFLIREAQGTGGTSDLPAPDASGTIAMSARSGKIAVASDTLAVIGPTAPNVVDFIGYGAPNHFEGNAPADSLTNTTCAERKASFLATALSMAPGGSEELKGNGFDGNNNASDFIVQSQQMPQNSSSPVELPSTENQPPIISAMIRTLYVPAVGTADSVVATIIDPDGVVAGGKLHIRVNAGAYDSSIALTNTAGSTWAAVIPAAKHSANGVLAEYFVSATDDFSKYSSTTLEGYFVGDAPIASVKSHPVIAIEGYAVQVNGVINVQTNTHSPGQGFLQDATGGLQLFRSGGLPPLAPGRNARVRGPITRFNNSYEINPPEFVDTAGTVSLTPVTIILPLAESASNINEGKLVRLNGITTDSTGIFTASKNYLFKNGLNDTITIRVESNGTANTLIGKPIAASSVNAIGILSYSGTFLRLKPRSQTDLGFDPADGSGTAAIKPLIRLVDQVAVAETLTIAGDGINTIGGVSVSVPAPWTWTDTSSKLLSGAGFASAVMSVSGAGISGNPYVVTISNALVTSSSKGTIVLFHLTTPSVGGQSQFVVKTRAVAGVLSTVSASPAVNVASSSYDAISTGSWSDPAVWAGGQVPGASDDVSMSMPGVVVTIDAGNAQCRSLTITGSGSGPTAGPTLQFAPDGAPQLTVNGNLAISGGSGTGRGGRARLTSNGNGGATLILRHNIGTTTGNSTSSGSAGLNMNEGTVKITGASTDTLSNSAGLRLGNLQIGDGSSAKNLVWAPSRSSTLAIRSLIVRTGSTFWIGAANDSTANDIGNASSSGVATLTGGITIESAAAMIVQDFAGGLNSASINLDGGGITNNGTLTLRTSGVNSPDAGKRMRTLAPQVNGDQYTLAVGGFPAGAAGVRQTISGSRACDFADIVVGSTDTLVLQQNVTLPPDHQMMLNGALIEAAGFTVGGRIAATRTIARTVTERFGGIGLTIAASAAAPGVTTVTRVAGPGSAQSGRGHTSILRYFDILPANNAGLNAAVEFYYTDADLAGQTPAALELWRSADGGSYWKYQPGFTDVLNRKLTASGIFSLSRLTASDSAHPLGTRGAEFFYKRGWNMISIPLTVTDYRKKTLYPSAVSNAFAFNGGYERKDTLQNGVGYWVKFPAKDTSAITGPPRLLDTVKVHAGWNMIGSIGSPLPTASIVEVPGGIVTSQLFAYTGAYVRSDTIWPGSAYWVKTNSNGIIILSASAPAVFTKNKRASRQGLNSITFTDNAGRRQHLYFGVQGGASANDVDELPPVPPPGSFDVRFASQRFVETFPAHLVTGMEFPIRIQAEALPVTAEWNVESTSGYAGTLSDGRSTFRLKGNGRFTILSPDVDRLVLRIVGEEGPPPEFALGANHPNPCNSSTSFRIAVPLNTHINVGVYDLLD